MILDLDTRQNDQNAGEAPAVDEMAELMRLVGQRVRSVREERKISRRELSERSEVSPRYLAQLEAGHGNISIGLLQKIATALDYRLEWFVGQNPAYDAETSRLLKLYASAPDDIRKKAIRTLDTGIDRQDRAQRICLIGLRGAGKSTLGQIMGEKLDVGFIELNSQIERNAGMAIGEIIALYGQQGYRQLEAMAIDSIADTHDRVVLAVAGGIVEEPETFENLLNRYHTIWVKASPEEHMERVRAQGDTRPMAGNPRAMEQLRNILVTREQQYAKADAMLDTHGKAVAVSGKEAIRLVEREGFLAG